MMFSRSLILFGAATVLLGQTPPPSAPATPPSMPQVHMSVEEPPTFIQPNVPPDRVVITVGDIKITAAQFDSLVSNLQPQYRNAAQGAQRKTFADNIVKMLSLAQEAQKRKLDQTADFKTQEMFQGFNLLANTIAGQVSKELKVPETDIRAYYDAHKADYETVHAKHILIRFQGSQVPVRPGQKDLSDAEALAKAEDLHKQLQNGGDFATIAKAESDDIGSGSAGGDMAAFKKGQMVPSFEAAAFAMKPGELSEPVKSQFGYHLILVVSHDTKPFEEVRGNIETTLKPQQNQKAVAKFIDDLQKATPPVFDAEFFPPSVPPAPAGAPSAPKAPDKK